MLSLAGGVGWAPVITARVFASPNPLEKVIKKIAIKCGHIDFNFPALFTQVLDLLLASHPGRLIILLILWPHSTLWFIHNTTVLLGKTKSFQHEHVCQNHRIVVKQYIQPCRVFDDDACM